MKTKNIFSKVTGLVIALTFFFGTAYANSGNGDKLKSVQDSIESGFEKTYGSDIKLDATLKSGSEYSIPDDILIDLLEHMFREGDPEIFLSVYSNSDDDVREKLVKRLNIDDDRINKIMNAKINVGSAMKFT
jgi:hypothetical protein